MRQTSTWRDGGRGGGGGERGGVEERKSESRSEKLTSEPAAAQLMRLLLGLAIQKVEVALKRVLEWGKGKREKSLVIRFLTNTDMMINKRSGITDSQKTTDTEREKMT